MSERISIDAMQLFTETCRNKEPHEVVQWFQRNAADFENGQLYDITRQLLYTVVGCMDDPKEHLEDIALELDEIYEDEYELSQVNPKKKFKATFKEETTQVVEIWAEDLEDAQKVADQMLYDEDVDMDKNPSDYEFYVDKVEEVKES